ncbi:MAG: PTS sugar transporter subunit IIC [Bacillota bacterium]|nr:PTS sugar transporter subunit IIC [Bacillota bacterium]
MVRFKKYMYHIFIDGLSGMALGLFATLIIGTIIAQIASLIPGDAGYYMNLVASVAKSLTGAGIGVGIACKFKLPPLVTVSAATGGMVGAFASKILAGTVFVDGVIHFAGPGEPLGAFVGAFVAVEFGRLVSGKTPVDILVTPIVAIGTGSIAGLIAGPPISALMTAIGELINWGAEQQPFLIGIIVSVLMGMALTLPISSAAIGIALGLSGIAAGAATVGCCCQMVGFAVMSYRENKMGGLIAQGLGTSMLQIPNIFKKPVVWLPPTIASAILGPVSSYFLGMTSNAIGSGMGTSGLVGPIMAWQTMAAEGAATGVIAAEIVIMYFIAPAAVTLAISEFMRKKGWIRFGDLKLEV